MSLWCSPSSLIFENKFKVFTVFFKTGFLFPQSSSSALAPYQMWEIVAFWVRSYHCRMQGYYIFLICTGSIHPATSKTIHIVWSPAFPHLCISKSSWSKNWEKRFLYFHLNLVSFPISWKVYFFFLFICLRSFGLSVLTSFAMASWIRLLARVLDFILKFHVLQDEAFMIFPLLIESHYS